VSLAKIAARNVLRNKFRAVMTMLGVAVAIVTFILLRTVIFAWTVAVDHGPQDRVATRHKVTFIMPLPLRYEQDLAQIPGVKETVVMNWFGGKHPTRDDEFFATIAVDPENFLKVYDEIQVSPEAQQAWFENRQGAIVGKKIADRFGWKVGDKVVIRGTIFPGNWDFQVSGIYTASRQNVDESTFFFHWKYLNESVDGPMKDQAGWLMSKIDGDAATISKAIDSHFESREIQTLSMSETAMNKSFLGMASQILKAVDVVSVVILVIMLLILGNTIAMGVRERTHEYGVLRAIGFMPKHLAGFVVGESVLIGLFGGAIGLLLAYPIVEGFFGKFLEQEMGAFFPYFRIETNTAILAFALAGLLGILAGAIPARNASKLDVVDSLRTVG
jgi:putative ABC transport system permease protein